MILSLVIYHPKRFFLLYSSFSPLQASIKDHITNTKSLFQVFQRPRMPLTRLDEVIRATLVSDCLIQQVTHWPVYITTITIRCPCCRTPWNTWACTAARPACMPCPCERALDPRLRQNTTRYYRLRYSREPVTGSNLGPAGFVAGYWTGLVPDGRWLSR